MPADAGERERHAVGNIPASTKLKSGPARNLPERAFVAPLLVGEVRKERNAGEYDEIRHSRQGGIRKQHCFDPIMLSAGRTPRPHPMSAATPKPAGQEQADSYIDLPKTRRGPRRTCAGVVMP